MLPFSKRPAVLDDSVLNLSKGVGSDSSSPRLPPKPLSHLAQPLPAPGVPSAGVLQAKASRFPAAPSSRPLLPPLRRDDDEKTMVKVPTPRPSASPANLAVPPSIPSSSRVPSFRPVAQSHAHVQADLEPDYNADERTMLRPGLNTPPSSSSPRLPTLPPISPGSLRAAPQTGSAVIPVALREMSSEGREPAAPATIRPVTLAPAHRYPHLAKTMPVSGRTSDAGGAVITTRTHVLAGGRPTMSWFAAIMATGVFLGLLSAVIARGDSDALLDATAAFVDPAHTARAAAAQPAAVAPQGALAQLPQAGQGVGAQGAANAAAYAAANAMQAPGQYAQGAVPSQGQAAAPVQGVDPELAQRLPPGFVQNPQQVAVAQPVQQVQAQQAAQGQSAQGQWGYPAPVANPNAVQPQAVQVQQVQQPVAQAPAPRYSPPVYRQPVASNRQAAPARAPSAPVTSAPVPAAKSSHSDEVTKTASDELSRMLLERSL